MASLGDEGRVRARFDIFYVDHFGGDHIDQGEALAQAGDPAIVGAFEVPLMTSP